MKKNSVFFHENVQSTVRTRAASNHGIIHDIEHRATFWMDHTLEEMAAMVPDPNLLRAYHVKSDGQCPACFGQVPLFNWQVDAFKRPFKVACPHCHALFPKNDFQSYYTSGLNENGRFDASYADRSLLTNPLDSSNPTFGVDDGHGYLHNGQPYRFIAYYILWGQWTQLVKKGLKTLGKAYLITKKARYATAAGALLYAIAQQFPSYDYMEQGIMYDREKINHGYVSYWLVSCLDVRDMALCYDMIFEAIRDDEKLVAFCAKHTGSDPNHFCFRDVQRLIERNIFEDALANTHKIKSNVPQTAITEYLVKSVLQQDEQTQDRQLADIIEQTVRVDGTTGEKGLVTYTAYALWGLCHLLWYYELKKPNGICELIKRFPAITDAFDFFIHTWCLQRYYPRIGDTGCFNRSDPHYAVFSIVHEYDRQNDPDPCIETVLWHLFLATDNPNYIRLIQQEHNNDKNECFHNDLFIEDPTARAEKLRKIIKTRGKHLEVRSMNFSHYKLAVLHAGTNDGRIACWMHYDSGGFHGHLDALTLGLFAHGHDLLPDFGYPPVHQGWIHGQKDRMAWYRSTRAHHTVTVDEADHKSRSGFVPDRGDTTLWAVGHTVSAMRHRCKEAVDCERFERLAILVSISNEAHYVLDISYVIGGSVHVKHVHGALGHMKTDQLTLEKHDASDVDPNMQSFAIDHNPVANWSATWIVHDTERSARHRSSAYLKYMNMSDSESVTLSKSWVSTWFGSGNALEENAMEDHVLSLSIRKKGDAPLHSTFCALLEPYTVTSNIRSAQSMNIGQDPSSLSRKIVVHTNQAMCDTFYINDADRLEFDDVKTDASIAWFRKSHGHIIRAGLVNGSFFESDLITIQCAKDTTPFEVHMNGRPIVKGGDEKAVVIVK